MTANEELIQAIERSGTDQLRCAPDDLVQALLEILKRTLMNSLVENGFEDSL